MTIIDLKAHSIHEWKRPILEHYRFPPYWWIRGVNAESHAAMMDDALERAITASDSVLIGYLSDGGDLLGFAHVRRLEWDSNHFAAEIWRLEHLGVWGDLSEPEHTAGALAQESIRAVLARGGKGIQARVPISNLHTVHVLEKTGFQTMEILTTWLFDLARSPLPPKKSPESIRDFVTADTESLIELARTAYEPTPDRFHMDPHLSPQACSELYAEWLRNSCSGQLADHIAVVEAEGGPVGYATLRYFDDYEGRCNVRIAQLGLGAVSPDFRNRGFVTDAIAHNLEWLKHRRGDFCFVGTQGNNIPPQRVWLKIGFTPALMSLTMHYWADS